jgi:hypothetical protein
VATLNEVPRLARHRLFCLIGLRSPIVQLSRAEQNCLRRAAAGRQNVVELGVAEGGSAALIAHAMDPSGTLHLVDPFFPGKLKIVGLHELIARRLLRSAPPKLVFVKLLSHKAPSSVDVDQVDFLFVDADHSEHAVRRDWNAWSSRLAPGAVVALHDALDVETGLPSAVPGPGLLLRDLLDQGWQLYDRVGTLAVIHHPGEWRATATPGGERGD